MMEGFAWEQLWLSPLEQGLNRYLKLDPAWPRWLLPLQDRSLAVVLRPFKLRTLIYLGRSGFRLSVDALTPADVQIEGAPSTFITYLVTKQMSLLLADGRLQVTGDLQLLQAFEALMQQVKPDWEDLLAGAIGDTMAYRIGQGVNSVKATCTRGREVLGRQLTEYLQDELALLPASALLQDFYREVDLLRQAADRLEARTALFARDDRHSLPSKDSSNNVPLPLAGEGGRRPGEGLMGTRHE
jgi:ubiquinone biosynthesis protein UbiJ